jgi:hypothetical protein
MELTYDEKKCLIGLCSWLLGAIPAILLWKCYTDFITCWLMRDYNRVCYIAECIGYLIWNVFK